MSWLEGLKHVVREDEPLAPHCWLGIGGSAEFFAEPTSVEELQQIVQRSAVEQRPLRVIGSGSNLLVHDHGVPGVVLHLIAPAFSPIEVHGQQVRAGGGAYLGPLISTCVRDGLAGLEPLVGIPGTVGGGLHGNAGDRSTDIGSYLTQATVMTSQGEIVTRGRQEIQFGYRESGLDELVILDATFTLEPEDRMELTRRLQKLWIVRRSREPTRDKRAVCLFQDPQSATASEVIEQAGLKGATVGGAGLYERDLNFVTAAPEASSDDVIQLMELVRDRVSHRTGIELEPALQVW